jgi:hypothetical protein
MNADQLVAEAHEALRLAHRRLLDPTPQGIDSSRSAFATAVQHMSELRGMLRESCEAGRGLLPAMRDLHVELETVTTLLHSAAHHQSQLLRRMQQAAAAEPQYFAPPVETGSRLQLNA